jgi:hypothetical protein
LVNKKANTNCLGRFCFVCSPSFNPKEGKTGSRRGAKIAEKGQKAFFDPNESCYLAISCIPWPRFPLCALRALREKSPAGGGLKFAGKIELAMKKVNSCICIPV